MDNTFKICKDYLDGFDAFTPSINPHIAKVMSAIPFNIPERMKALIAQSQTTSFVSQFRRNIILWDDTSVPINSISFSIANSGDGKDSSVKAARKCFASGYKMIEDAREAEAIKIAKNLAREAGETLYNEYDIYKNYIKPLPPVDIRTTTGPGFIQHINDLGEHRLGSGIAYSGEFSDELAYNQDMLENIKILSESFDTGELDIKYTKSIENRSKAIKGQPVSALYVTSPSHILYDEATKKKFQVAFMSKLARRSWFCYTPERIAKAEPKTVQEIIDYEYQIEAKAKAAREAMKADVNRIAEFGIKTAQEPIGVTEEVFNLYKIYQRYNSELADKLPNQHSTAVLVRRHLQWKAIKLAGALAICDLSNDIQAHHYIDAIRFCELLADDISIFEAELNKAEHERLADYLQTLTQADGKAFISLHDIKKKGFSNSTTTSKLKELATLANAYDKSGVYSALPDGTGITYEAIIKTDVLSISFKPIDISRLEAATKAKDPEAISKAKADIAATTAYGYEVAETSFPELYNLLLKSYAYSPFKFESGIRGKDHIVGGTKWIVIDVDNSQITAEEAHFMLQDVNHHIALTSDPNNPFKFRVLIELDSPVELNNIQWKHFFQSVTEDLALKADMLPQSQIYYSYPNRTIYSQLDASPLEVKPYLVLAAERTAAKPAPSSLTAAARKDLIADPETTFSFAFHCPEGSGSRSLMRAAYYARDLGMPIEDIINLIHEINSFWSNPMDAERLELTVLSQIQRWR